MHADMTAVPIQSDKIVLNEVKRQLSTTRATAQKKKNVIDFMANPIILNANWN